MNKCTLSLLIAFIIELILIFISFSHIISAWVMTSYVVWALAAIIFTYVFRKNTALQFLFSLFCILVIIRISDHLDNSLVGWFGIVPLIILAVSLFSILREQYQKNQQQFALTFIRLFIGYNFITHTTEKLFAGPVPHNALKGFFGPVVLGTFMNPTIVPAGLTEFMIYWAGLTELTIAICLGMGLFTRFGAFLAIAYMIAAMILGHHFAAGYTWALPGWEFTFFWALSAFPFLFKGTSGPLSLDYIVRNKKDA